jgi:hypothetical protein
VRDSTGWRQIVLHSSRREPAPGRVAAPIGDGSPPACGAPFIESRPRVCAEREALKSRSFRSLGSLTACQRRRSRSHLAAAWRCHTSSPGLTSRMLYGRGHGQITEAHSELGLGGVDSRSSSRGRAVPGSRTGARRSTGGNTTCVAPSAHMLGIAGAMAASHSAT